MKALPWDIIVIGSSAGGLHALENLLTPLPDNYPIPIAIVQHLPADSENYLPIHLNQRCQLTVKEANDIDTIQPSHVYIAPGGYHMLIENESTLALCVGEKINYSRPSVDVLFTSAVDVFAERVLAIVLTGANKDGTEGALWVHKHGGTVIAQDPNTAEAKTMPESIIKRGGTDHVFTIEKITEFMLEKVIHGAATN